MRFRFGNFELETLTRSLRRGGRDVSIEPRVFDLLVHLVVHRDRVVSRRELLAALWPDVVVSPAALSRSVQKARRVVGDSGEDQRVIRTHHGRGFRFVASLLDDDAASSSADGFEARSA